VTALSVAWQLQKSRRVMRVLMTVFNGAGSGRFSGTLYWR
jgi:hypothetical protein